MNRFRAQSASAARHAKRAHKHTFDAIPSSYRRNRWLFIVRLVVIIGVVIFFAMVRSIWTPDTLLIALLLVGLIFGKVREFATRFVPFLGLLVVYDSMRSIAPKLNTYVNYWPMIHFDRWLGNGQIISSRLQQLMWHGHVQWYDFYFYLLYTFHFLMPVVLGLVLWRWRPRLYWPFVWTIITASFLAFIVYVLFPAAPPWLAAQNGYLSEPLHRVSSDVWWAMGVKNFSEIYTQMAPNAVAAVPSLHSAYPLIAALFVLLGWGKRAWWITLYPLSMWLGVIYLGEHYLFDIIAAWIDVTVAVIIVRAMYRWRQRRVIARGQPQN